MTRYLTYQGQTKGLAEWAREFGLSRWTLWERLHLGWSIEKALTTPVIPRSPPTKAYSRLTFRGQTKSLAEWAEEFGLRADVIRSRFHLGWSIEAALTTPVHKKAKAIRYQLRYRGQTKSLVEWAEELGLSPEVVRRRLHLGWSIKKALATPVHKRGRPIRIRPRYRGQTKSLAEWAEEFDIPAEVLRSRLHLGWTMEEALTTPVRHHGRKRRLRSSANPPPGG